jgi:cytoplasmic iron level regulating protein YaaA (DUF328/UPF0246 family)
MKVLIITEDSAIKLPQINKWTNKITKGMDIEKDDALINLLKKHNSTIPSDDLENEENYKKVLRIYVRPAKFMFSGMFSEVRDFSNRLAKITPTDLYIISGRYGLINENDSILPYSKNVKTIPELKNLDEKTGFFEKTHTLVNKYSLIIFLLPRQYIQYFITKEFFESIPKNHPIVIVTGTHNCDIFSKYPMITILPRKGVARIGNKNRNKIIEIIKNRIGRN